MKITRQIYAMFVCTHTFEVLQVCIGRTCRLLDARNTCESASLPCTGLMTIELAMFWSFVHMRYTVGICTPSLEARLVPAGARYGFGQRAEERIQALVVGLQRSQK